MGGKMRGVLGVAVAVVLGCGGASSASNKRDAAQPLTGCGPDGIQPPAKLIIPPSGGVTGRWTVVLNNDVSPLPTFAADLATRYGGLVLEQWESINGFAMSMDDSKAPALSEEPTVCWVEQDQLVSVQ